jgi:N-methylhydantoinase B
VAFIGTIAHSPDMGGSLWGAGARDLFEEGLMIPPMKLYDAGTPNDTLYHIIEANVRTPRQTIGDIRAQLTANDQGSRSLLGLMEEADLSTIDDLAQQIQDVSEKAMREAIAKAPDGTYHYEYDADGDGFDEPVKIRIAITIEGDEIAADYTGTSGAHSLSLNAVMNYVYAYTAYPIKCIFSPDVPNNEGSFHPIKVTAPLGSLLNAQAPVPLGARNITGNMLHALVFGALAQAVPQQVQADCGAPCWSVVLNGREKGRRQDAFFVEFFFLNGGYGARPHLDGAHTLSFPTNVANVPTEVMENDMPVRFLEKSLRPDTGGAGQYRGGLGQTVTFTMIGDEPINLSLLTEKTRTCAQGVCGGGPGASGSVEIEPPRRIAPKGLTKLYPGDTLRLRLPGGGGYGNPADRDPEAARRDVEQGYVTPTHE